MLKIFERMLSVMGIFFVLLIVVVQGHELTLPILGAALLATYYVFEEEIKNDR